MRGRSGACGGYSAPSSAIGTQNLHPRVFDVFKMRGPLGSPRFSLRSDRPRVKSVCPKSWATCEEARSFLQRIDGRLRSHRDIGSEICYPNEAVGALPPMSIPRPSD